MPSDKFVRNDAEGIFLLQGFSVGTAEADQGDNHAVVVSAMVQDKPAIILIIPESSVMDLIEHLHEAKAKLERKRKLSQNVITGGKEN